MASSNIIISFSIAILLLLILLLLVSYNSKCKLDNSEKFDDNRLYAGYDNDSQFIPSNYANVERGNTKQSQQYNSVSANGTPQQSIGDISNKNHDFNNISGGLGNLEASNGHNNEYFNPVSSTNTPPNPLTGTGGSTNDTSCFTRDRLTSSDLLPKDANNAWTQANPATSGDVRNQNYLTSGYHIGINTIGQSLRNANLQLRSEIPNPQIAVSPWMISTIEPDIRATNFEIGSSASN